MTQYRNMHEALPSELDYLLGNGDEITSRGGTTRELRHHTLTLTRPWERFQFHPARADNPFAKIAETLWVLAGRNDIDWLSYYLPRAPDFSDDGRTWRAAYGPRIRNWPGVYEGQRVDQLYQTYNRLKANPADRRAVINLWDPARDGNGLDSKDFPCNNWLHFLVRGGHLDLAVAVRSNDVMWGWSGINAFEWSVLQEAMAFWLGVDIGNLTTFVSSWHIYHVHWERAQRIADEGGHNQLTYFYERYHRRIPWGLTLPELPAAFNLLWRAEAKMRVGSAGWIDDIARIHDPFFTACAQMLNIYSQLQRGAERDTIADLLACMQPESDFRAAAHDYTNRHFVRKAGVPDVQRS